MWARSSYTSLRDSLGTSCPSTNTVPSSGSSSPTMCLIATDFPVPDPPITTIVSPSDTSSEKPRRTCLVPKDLWTSTRRIKRKRRLGYQVLVITKAVSRAGRWLPLLANKKGRAFRLALKCQSLIPLRREAPERASNLAFAQALQRTIAELPNALAGDAEHRADLLERVLASAFQAEVEPQHLRVQIGRA